MLIEHVYVFQGYGAKNLVEMCELWGLNKLFKWQQETGTTE